MARSRPGPRAIAVAALCLAVAGGAALAVALVVPARTSASERTAAAGGDTASGVVGRWGLTSVRTRSSPSPVAIPADFGAYVVFRPSGGLFADDTVSAYNADYVADSSAVTLTNQAVSANGYVGDDATVLAAGRAIVALTTTSSCAYVRSADLLTLTCADTTLTLANEGPASDETPPVPTSTSS